ncbi:MAG: C25 family cysteine peptidase [Caldilineaceae bacterium]
MSLPVYAQPSTSTPSESPLTLLKQTNGLHIHWQANSTTVSAADLTATLPTMRYQGYELPMQLVTVAVQNEVELANFAVEQVSANVIGEEAIQPAVPLMPEVIDSENEFDLTSTEIVALPTAPAFVLRTGMLDGKMVAVLALSPIYREQGQIKVASEINAYAPGTVALDDNNSAPSAADLSPAAAIPSAPPTNTLSTKKSAKIVVATPGMQHIPFSAITGAGLTTNGLALTHNGKAIAIQVANSEVRFYAGPTVGDRWNSNEIYWLTDKNTATTECQTANVCSMKSRSVAPGSAANRTQGVEKGLWSQTPEYISRYGGPDGDHWFNSEMNIQSAHTISPNITSLLPAAGSTSYTLQLTPLTRTDDERRCTLRLKSGAETLDLDINAMVSTSQGMVLKDIWAGTITTTASVNSISVSLLSRVVPKNPSIPPSPPACTLYFDTIAWARTVTLNLNGKSVAFSGVEGSWNYKWSNLPTGHAMYDISDPDRPLILTGYSTTGFQDGPTAHDYIVVGSNGLQTPQVVADSGFNFASITGAHEIYLIAPGFDRLKNSRTILEPLVTLRQSQGYKVAIVDVQEVYDAWSYGKVSPEAIRSFLQYAATHWNPAPLAAVLVGDGTLDPKNLGPVPSDKTNNINFIPPYMGQGVDPWLGEAACDNCYGQLNGADAVSGDNLSNNNSFFDTDIWIGRFPVKYNQELSTVVNKIIAYETTGTNGDAWRRTTIFVADNYVRSAIENKPVVYDPAGNFAKDSETQISRLLSTNHVERVYYDPYPKYSGAKPGETWRISTPNDVMPKVISVGSRGAGLFVYNGHSNHWNMGNLELDVLKNGVMTNENVANVLTLYDVDGYSNSNKYFIQLSMTCLTSQFVKPAASGTTIDERVFLNANGGAVALWGPAGLSVAHGHDKLQEGFFDKLEQNINMNTPIGQMLDAGYQQLLLKGTCCQDALETFLFFGDPLTPTRVFTPLEVYLPLVNR